MKKQCKKCNQYKVISLTKLGICIFFSGFLTMFFGIIFPFLIVISLLLFVLGILISISSILVKRFKGIIYYSCFNCNYRWTESIKK